MRKTSKQIAYNSTMEMIGEIKQALKELKYYDFHLYCEYDDRYWENYRIAYINENTVNILSTIQYEKDGADSTSHYSETVSIDVFFEVLKDRLFQEYEMYYNERRMDTDEEHALLTEVYNDIKSVRVGRLIEKAQTRADALLPKVKVHLKEQYTNKDELRFIEDYSDRQTAGRGVYMRDYQRLSIGDAVEKYLQALWRMSSRRFVEEYREEHREFLEEVESLIPSIIKAL